jgi:hypothetical protein
LELNQVTEVVRAGRSGFVLPLVPNWPFVVLAASLVHLGSCPFVSSALLRVSHQQPGPIGAGTQPAEHLGVCWAIADVLKNSIPTIGTTNFMTDSLHCSNSISFCNEKD